MNWTNKAWLAITPIYTRIQEMPFIKELKEGTLALEKFQFYMDQDAHYLEHFARALAIIGARTKNVDNCLAFIRFAEGAVVVERALHDSYFKEFNLKERGKLAPTTHHYIHFLESTASLAQVEVAMAAVLPCFWIYKEIGDFIYKNTAENNPYKNWIDTYAGEEFGKSVTSALAICNAAAENCTPEQQEAMTEAFIAASNLEFMFWDSAYKLHQW
ncbi:thiaminase/transcriptional activator TenA [Mesonia hippocampi]|uniref:Aminopyrimidine aminohydrolase n=1 Tax=Mesonia hippocampi TaxID=1628250 RepID=A0A840EG01_9FLAO|nr:thiaminase II [Mesonia hippocampi]MBB4118152.1 thiaminase/transcriptional activator TenA [Mesonia hippocampi]